MSRTGPQFITVQSNTSIRLNVLERVVKGIPAERIIVRLTHLDGERDIKAVTKARVAPCPSGERHTLCH
jgi:hypothetical protein